jgi:hypothetical protein
VGDIGDYWREARAWKGPKEAAKEKREQNRKSSTHLLTKHGIAFETNNDGHHLIIVDGADTYDFWPGTGKWNRRSDATYYRGVRELIGTIMDRRGAAKEDST